MDFFQSIKAFYVDNQIWFNVLEGVAALVGVVLAVWKKTRAHVINIIRFVLYPLRFVAKPACELVFYDDNEVKALSAVRSTSGLHPIATIEYFPIWKSALGSKRPTDMPVEPYLIGTAEKSVKFLTISGRSVYDSQVERVIIEKSGRKDFEIRLLLFDWTSPFFERKMKDEGRFTEGEIEAARVKALQITQQFLGLGKKTGANVKIKLYQSYPIWRFMVIDEKIAYAGFYQHGKRGYEGPMYILPESQNSSLFYPLNSFFEELWEESGEPLQIGDRRFVPDKA